MSIDGDISFSGTIVIDGQVNGSVKGNQLKMGDSGMIAGDVIVKDFDCGGKVRGVVSSQQLRMRKGSEIEGAIFARELEMVPGALVNGEMRIGPDQEYNRTPPVGGSVGLSVSADTSAEKPGVVIGDTDSEDATSDYDEVQTESSIVDGLAGALDGGSSVIMVVSEEADSRRLVYRDLKKRLGARYEQLFIEEPTGSFGEMLVRVAKGFGIELSDLSDQEVMIRDLSASMSGSGRNILVLDNVERMYPATLERMIQYLAADENGENELTKLLLFGSTDLKKMLDFGDSSIFTREPDCVV